MSTMMYNELEELALESTISFPEVTFFKDITNVNKLSIDHLAASLFCRNVPNYKDYPYVHADKVLSFSPYKIKDRNLTNREYIGLVYYLTIKEYFNDLNIPAGTLTAFYNKLIKLKKIDNDDLKYSSKLFIDMNQKMDYVSKLVENCIGTISNERIYFSFGRKPRKTYYIDIDLIIAHEDGVEVVILTPINSEHVQHASSRTLNIRVLGIMKHFDEIGVKVKGYHEILIPFKMGDTGILKQYGNNPVMLKYAYRFFQNDNLNNSNLTNCRTCSYNKQCTYSDMIPIVPI